MNKKDIIYMAIASVTIITLLFLAFAFGNWSLNPATWNGIARMMCAALSLVGVIISISAFTRVS